MKIKAILVSDFKRFHHLTITNIPASAKLVVLAGPNGYGKSSLFDAFLSWHRARSNMGRNRDSDYYLRTASKDPHCSPEQKVQIQLHSATPTDQQKLKGIFYIRSAYRNDPDFTTTNIQQQAPTLDEIRFSRLIENDAAVAKNYAHMTAKAMHDIFKPADSTLTVVEFQNRILHGINEALHNVFPHLTLTSFGEPPAQGSFFFTKGISTNFHYKNLSGGEKAAFDLIIDLIAKKDVFNDTIFCIDEPEAHLNTRVQGSLLRAILDIIPDNSQLWIATHAIGMMRAARDIWSNDPAKVCFFDFEGLDFDQPQVVNPVQPSRAFWRRALNVALDDLSSLIAPERIVICEGTPRNTPNSGANADHDSQCYNAIFATTRPDALFISGGNASEVISDHYVLVAGLNSAAMGAQITRLVDRDAQSDQEVEELKKRKIRVLSKRHLEGYLWSEEMLTKLCNEQGKPDKISEIIAELSRLKNDLKAQGKPDDDLKSISGQMYVFVKRTLALHTHGNTAKAFMRDTLSPLVTPDTKTYKDIENDIFGMDESAPKVSP